MNLQYSAILAVVLSLIGLTAWEIYWRQQGFSPTLDDDDELYAIHRSKVNDASEDDVVIVGSSRAYFDLQLNEWEKITGKRPIQLAIEGASPQYVFDDIVNNTDYKGTIVVGVTEFLFFSTLYPQADPNSQPTMRAEYMKKRTYAQRLNHKLSIPLQKNLAFVSNVTGTDGIKLNALLKKIKIGNRIEDPMPPFHVFAEVDETRNLRMTSITENDTAYANTIKKVWLFFLNQAAESGMKPEKEETTAFFLKNLEKFKARGGKVILVRCPSSGQFYEIEKMAVAREEYWNPLVEKANVPAYFFDDFEEYKNYECPEWSHLSGKDADDFTRKFVTTLVKDGHLKKWPKTN